jgi:hypothetical protein
MSLFQTLIELQNNDLNEMAELDKNLIAISMYIYFNYEQIMLDPRIIEFINNSQRVLNKFHRLHPEFNQKQIESIFLAFNILMILCINQILYI